MNQKQKIIILLSFLFCGSLIIFLSLRDNNQKNNLQVKKKEKENNQNVVSYEEQQESSSSFLFWVVLIIILFVGSIICYVIYRSRQKNEEVPGTKTNPNINPEKNEKPKTEGQPKEIINKNKDSAPNVFEKLLKNNEGKELKCFLYYNKNSKALLIVLLHINNADILNEQSIENILEDDLNEVSKLGIPKEHLQQFEKTLKKILQEITNYLTTYLTDQLLKDVLKFINNDHNYYYNKQLSILTSMAKISKLENETTCYLRTIPIKSDQKATAEDLNDLQENKLLKLLSTVLQRRQATFIECQGKNNDGTNTNKICVPFFRRFFTFYQLFIEIHSKIIEFLNQNKEKQPKLSLKKIISHKCEIEKLISPEKIK